MFRIAARDESLSSVPFFPMVPESKPRNDVLPQEQYPELVKALPAYPRLPLIIAWNTGMREGEILGLTWGSNIDWMEKIIRVEDTKNGDDRELPFSGELEAALREAHAKRDPGCDFICYRVDRKGHARQIGDFRKPRQRCCIKLGLGKLVQKLDPVTGEPLFEKPRYPKSKPKPKVRYNGLVFHGLRRTFITDAEHAGVPRHEAMVLSGHRTEAVGDNSGTIQQSSEPQESVIN
jgi:integrase